MSNGIFRIWHRDGRIEERELGPGDHEIGRGIGTIALDDPNVSLRHARIRVQTNQIVVEDLGSSNGMIGPDGQRLQGPLVLELHRPIQVGETQLALIGRSGVGASGTQLMPMVGAQPPAFGLLDPRGAHAMMGPVGLGAVPNAPSAPMPYVGQSPHAGAAPFGIDPVSGLAYSDKSKLTAGLLQIIFGWLAIGRFYMGDMKTALLQIGVCVGFGMIGAFFTCGMSMVVFLWPLIDGIMILAGKVTDPQGRPLRP